MELSREQVKKLEFEKQYKINMNKLKKHSEAYLFNFLRKQNPGGTVFGMKITEYVDMLKNDLEKNK